jgi:hypothetical protein
MSITNYVNELQTINKEIKRQSIETSKLRKRAKDLETHIEEFLKDKDQLGVKFGNVAIVLETKPKFSVKPKKDKDDDSIKILENIGVENPREILEKLERTKKGDEFEHTKIKIKKLKTKKDD